MKEKKRPNGGRSEFQESLPLNNELLIPNLPVGNFEFLRPLKPTKVFSTYWRFASERQRIFLKRLEGASSPWTMDPVLQHHKFTNSYRASDRVSQFLIRDVIYKESFDVPDTVFRILLFKIFNKIETWKLLESHFGEICLSSYSFTAFDQLMSTSMEKGVRLYSAAYIMPSGGRSSEYARKHQMHLRLLERMIEDRLPDRLAEANSMAQAFDLMRCYPTIGDFLAYQYVTDINYSQVTNFKESEFVVPGPGARDGIRKCFQDLGGLTESEVIKFVFGYQERCIQAVNESFPTLWGRPLQPIDCQNLFCEIDKYSRVAHPDVAGHSGRTKIKQKLRPAPIPVVPFYPPKWGINHLLKDPPKHVSIT